MPRRYRPAGDGRRRLGPAIIIPAPLRAYQGPHRAVLEAAFGPTQPAPQVVLPDRRFVFLCFTNRCGSNYLAHLLATTGAFNEAGEVFNAEVVLQHARERGLRSLPDYVAALPGLLRDTGRIVLKAGVEQLVMLADAGVLDQLGDQASYILLERRDRLGQAISRAIAVQTGRFSTAQPRAVADQALVYSRPLIAAQLQSINQENGLFYVFFQANGITPIHTSLEAVLADPAPLVAAVAQATGAGPLTSHPYAVRLQRQANAVNRAWRAIYETGN